MDRNRPPADDNWHEGELANTGAWSVGTVWFDRSASCYGMWVRQEHCNALGVMHGGAMATFVDPQLAAVREYRPGIDAHTPTISLSVDYLAPAPLGSWLALVAKELRVTRNMIFSQALVTANDELVCRSNAIYRNAGPPA